LLGACLAAVLAAAPAAPQDGPSADGVPTYYWPHRLFSIPVDVARINRQEQRPTHLQLYYAVGRKQWQRGEKLPLDGLKDIGEGKKGFEFTAGQDGEYEFTVQHVFSDGSATPKDGELAPQMRIIIDSTPPTVRLFAAGNGVEWSAQDDNLDTRDPKAVTLECRWAKGGAWQKVTTRTFRTADRYAWTLQPGEVLEVRVTVKDRAGHEGVSPIVRIPDAGGSGTGVGRGDWPPRASDPLTRPGADPGTGVPQPSIFYVSTLKFDVDYAVQRMGRSGVKAAHLFVVREQGSWQPAKNSPFRVDVKPADGGQTLSLPYEADREGLYGFYVIPESGAGKRAADPTRDDQPMVLVEVDTTPPAAKITGVQVSPGPRGPVVEITWKVTDRNLMPRPVSLEYSIDRGQAQWREIKYQLENNLTRETGRYVWDVPDESLWKFWVRLRAVDKAANTATDVWEQEVIVDLEKPTAGIQKVRGGKDGPANPNPNPGGVQLKTTWPKGDDPKPNPPKSDRPVIPTPPAGGSPPLPALPDKPDASGNP
jgi:hypothetical protein